MATMFNKKWPNNSAQNEIKLAKQADNEPDETPVSEPDQE